MQQIQPDQAAFMLQMALPAIQREHDITYKLIEAIPLDKSDFRPDSISKPALELAYHIATAENRFLAGIAAGEFNFEPSTKLDGFKNSAELAAWYKETFATNFEALSKMTPEQLVKIMDFRGMFQNHAVAFLELAMRHTIHHRGQLSMYLRPMGAKVPSIYGESYDAAQARKSAQV